VASAVSVGRATAARVDVNEALKLARQGQWSAEGLENCGDATAGCRRARSPLGRVRWRARALCKALSH